MEQQSKKRDSFWDIMKGIGIICIILGHSCGNTKVISYVYLFHLPLFFFVTGYLFDPEKWNGRTKELIGSRIVSSWIRYMAYGLIFVLVHNFMVENGALAGEIYNHTAMLRSFLNYAVFAPDSSLAGALWFIPVWIFAVCIYAAASDFLRDMRLLGVFSVLSVILGLILYQREIALNYHIQTSFLAIGFLYLGTMVRSLGEGFRKYLHPAAGLLAGVLLYVIKVKFGIAMDLSEFYIPGPVMYVTASLGIYFCMCLSDVLSRWKVSEKVFRITGQYSFDIMALHFLVLKLIDLCYSRIRPGNPEALLHFPTGYSEVLWLPYLVFSVILPVVAGAGIDFVIRAVVSGKRSAKKSGS